MSQQTESVSRETLEDELEAIAPDRVRTVQYRGETIEVRPLTVLRMRHFIPQARPVARALNERLGGVAAGVSLEQALEAVMGDGSIFDLIEQHGESLAGAAAAAIGRDAEWVAEGEFDEFAELVTAVISVNLDFFVHRLLPRVTQIVGELGADLTNLGSGRTRSRSSSAKDTA